MITAPARFASASISSAARSGVLLMLLGMLMFSLNDVMGKWLVSTYSVGQVVFIRSVAALVVLAPFLWFSGPAKIIQVDRPWLQAARVVLSTAEVFAFYFAVVYLPLADVMTYWLAAPIYVAAVSPFVLKEPVGWRRWTAIIVGFIGVVIALEPSSQALTPQAIISILGSMFFAFMLLLGRSLRGTPDTTLVFWQIIGAGLAGLVAVTFEWTPVSLRDVFLLALLGVVAMLAHVLVNRALKLADAATVAPLQYTLLFWAILFGWLVFGDVPRVSMLVGSGFIVASGLFIFFREQQLKREGRMKAPAETVVTGSGEGP
ncbi:DMT family transporter [Phyllobacterium endophyticum]|uniref:EamA family transporter n=1 Tax=Phyllobacterium endophyticum TaxID=1149773 RepID=A0A2P7AZJ7_9HYPH|nr:DMT family transporter [Phyllobacterium endophyticum]MBB3235757.1 drug/metabolite transporter (DMT)-like permease [Phyllobacterium endophyticum]PSH59638.1 EamA family transporter [Phyllobacterium endophyticum]TXR48222.1 DMT family transporter [Phyllobacterium endophyticum]TYR41780.1 DMT family transporter [Phyllobacterium endophyticum]